MYQLFLSSGALACPVGKSEQLSLIYLWLNRRFQPSKIINLVLFRNTKFTLGTENNNVQADYSPPSQGKATEGAP